MSYTSEVVPTLGVKEGYDRAASMYPKYHAHLDSFDNAEWRRYLPRSLKGVSVLDLGAGDGRTFHWFKNTKFSRYVAVDICEDLLKTHPQAKGVETCICDLEKEWVWDSGSFDVITSFFVVEHIVNLQHLADSAERILVDGGVWIFTYFPQRREFVHGQGADAFKISLHYHRYEDVEDVMERAGLEVHSMELKGDEGGEIGRVYAGLKV